MSVHQAARNTGAWRPSEASCRTRPTRAPSTPIAPVSGPLAFADPPRIRSVGHATRKCPFRRTSGSPWRRFPPSSPANCSTECTRRSPPTTGSPRGTTRPRSTCCGRWSVVARASWRVRHAARCRRARPTTPARGRISRCGNGSVVLATRSPFPRVSSTNWYGLIWRTCCSTRIAWRRRCVGPRADPGCLRNCRLDERTCGEGDRVWLSRSSGSRRRI